MESYRGGRGSFAGFHGDGVQTGGRGRGMGGQQQFMGYQGMGGRG